MNGNTKNTKKVKRPSFFWLMTEAGRAVAEWGMSVPYRKFIANEACGDGHPVLVIPGFLASDSSTTILRNFLDDIGYVSYGWELGRNYGKEETLYHLSEYFQKIKATHRSRVTVIGWSLGGVYARQIAKMHPEETRQVITLGSPFQAISEANNVAWIYNLLTGGESAGDIDEDLRKDIPKPAPVPTTCLYSKQDGIVPWQYCMELEEDHFHQNIEVRSSHFGMAHNPSVLKIIADRLQYAPETWQHFYPGNIMEDLLLYPSFR